MLQQTAAKGLLFAILLLSCFSYAKAQLKADFSFDKPGGCSPLLVSFSNRTAGASSGAVYEWNFNNGNTSALKDPKAIFQDEKTYTVTLTVKDGVQTSTQTKTITIYKKPVADLVASVDKGCAPLPLTFKSNATAGDGTITNYFWDYGDGTTQQAKDSQTLHTYNTAQTPSVSLTVTNSYGCQSSIIKTKLVTVLPTLQAAFTADKTVLCTINEAANFTDNSHGPGTLSYKWDFGDGGTATNKQPLHVFKTAGAYTIKLTVNSSEGCSASSIQEAYINVANFKSNIEMVAPACKNNGTGFNNKSTPVPTQSLWEFGDGSSYYTYAGNNIYHTYTTTGSYTVKITNEFGACKDVVTKVIEVKEPPLLNGFIVDITSSCGAPVKVNYKDTTATAVKWKWESSWPSNFQSTEKAPSFVYTYDDNYFTTLTVTNEAGCSSYIQQPVSIHKPYVTITSPNIGPSEFIRSCGPLSLKLLTTTNEVLTSYKWDFGDNQTDTAAQPVHTFSKPGDYRVKLTYTTADGCTGIVEYTNNIAIRNKVKADFKASITNLCGNTPVNFINTTVTADPYYNYSWDLGDGNFPGYVGNWSVNQQYQQEGVYTIRLIATDWVCADTLVKKDYIKVSPPFPKIAAFTNTCEGTRGLVTFTQTSKQTDNWSWDFGDGTTLILNKDQPQIQHTYAKTGWYKVMLTNTNGQCTVKDSVNVPILLKQHPVLSADKNEICAREDFLKISISNLELNPDRRYYYNGYWGFMPYHRDGSLALSEATYADFQGIPITQTKWNFQPGKEGLWVVVTSNRFFCTDTSNIIPLKIKGPIAGFKVNNKQTCQNGNIAFLQDTSGTQDGIALVSWEWNFGDGRSETYTKAGEISHAYAYQGIYMVTLKVTDAGGCTSICQNWVDTRANLLKASFASSATVISPGSGILFTNTSISLDNTNTSYRWLLGDGSEAATYNVTKTYTTPGTYIVKLIARNNLTACADTATMTITVKYINAAFNFNTSYISNSNCPPVLVQFTNLSNNASKVIWDFGDGTIIENQPSPSHVYTKSGRYKITLQTYSDNGTVYTTVDSVIIKQPAASISADVLHGCTAQTITLKASAENAASYFWDFGDGVVQSTSDTSFKYRYASAGVFTPHLIAQDASGCAASVSLHDIVIDSLAVSLTLPSTICSPKGVYFAPVVVSVAADQAQQSLLYHWNFGTGKTSDTSNKSLPSFIYDQPGTYTVSLKVQSPYGCVKEVSKTIIAYQGLGGQINGSSEICQGASVNFTGSTLLQGQPQWKWIFEDGSAAQQQSPPARTYTTPGTYLIKLLVDNKGCIDTVTRSIQVHANPSITLSTKQAIVCEGASIALTATGGSTYQWSPGAGLNTTSGASVVAAPITNTTYAVIVANTFGCASTDSVKLSVIHPFKLQLASSAAVCSGGTLQLNASGAAQYQWIDNTATLSKANTASPIATPTANSVYRVIGVDAYNCFKDTAAIKVIVQPLPTVDAGQSAEILTGSPYQLGPVTSADVVKWSWSPQKYLSCSNCITPEAKPLEPITYTLTATNAFGCTAFDTVSIKLMCSESRIYIPNTFTPNNDGKNDKFLIKGTGIRIVNYLRIYNRWGEIVFERKNFGMDDKNAAWDGKYKGLPVPAGTYVYLAEMSCNEKSFIQKGTVTVVY